MKTAPQPFVHYLLFGCVLMEVFALEVFTVGEMRHVWDFITICIYSFGMLRIRGAGLPLAGVFAFGSTAAAIDLFDLHFAAFDLESMFLMLMNVIPVIVLAKRLFSVTEVRHVEIIDSVTIYLLAGIAFANVYAMVLWFAPGAVRHIDVPKGTRIGYDLVVYYSFITQAAVGYGDMYPGSRMTRTISVGQAIFGVMYIAILVSRFVSIHSSAHFDRHGRKDRTGF